MKTAAAWMMIMVSLAWGLGADPAGAMSIRSSEFLLAWSQDGRAFLINRSEDGPEGGGAESYRIVCPAEKLDEEFRVTSTFSPGDGSRPERVSVPACQQALGELNRLLQAHRFQDVACTLTVTAQTSRRGLVTTGEQSQDLIARGRFAPRGEQWVLDAMTLALQPGKLLLVEGGKTQTLPDAALAEPGLAPSGLAAYLSPGKNLLVLFRSRPRDGEREYLTALPLAVEPGLEPQTQRRQ
jgi:hypothetical protein